MKRRMSAAEKAEQIEKIQVCFKLAEQDWHDELHMTGAHSNDTPESNKYRRAKRRLLEDLRHEPYSEQQRHSPSNKNCIRRLIEKLRGDSVSGNIANGGLAAKWRGTVVFAKPNEWFLNSDDEHIYYSDRSDRNRLYRKREAGGEGTPVLKEPCSAVTLHEDGIYYINEDQMKIYHCSKEGRGRMQYSGESVTEFGLLRDGGIYANPGARRLCVDGQTAYFADVGNNYALTVADAASGAIIKVFPDVRPSFVNVHDGCVYYTDRMRGNAIYRLDTYGSKLSVFGSSSGYLHVIDSWLYFISAKKWHRLSLLDFGEAEEI